MALKLRLLFSGRLAAVAGVGFVQQDPGQREHLLRVGAGVLILAAGIVGPGALARARVKVVKHQVAAVFFAAQRLRGRRAEIPGVAVRVRGQVFFGKPQRGQRAGLRQAVQRLVGGDGAGVQQRRLFRCGLRRGLRRGVPRQRLRQHQAQQQRERQAQRQRQAAGQRGGLHILTGRHG